MGGASGLGRRAGCPSLGPKWAAVCVVCVIFVVLTARVAVQLETGEARVELAGWQVRGAGWPNSSWHPGSVPIPPALASPNFWVAQSMRKTCGFSHGEQDGSFEGENPWSAYSYFHDHSRRLILDKKPYARALVWHCLDGENCNGFADQLKGLSSTLFLGMMTNRALFIQWRRHGQDVLALLGRPSIDWEVPEHLFGFCKAPLSYLAPTADLADAIIASSEPCLNVSTNANPSFLENYLRNATLHGEFESMVTGINDALRERVMLEYRVGCAANFLFSFSRAWQGLLARGRLRLPPGVFRVPRKYIGIHLRLGDNVFVGDDKPNEEVVKQALECAAELGQSLFGTRTYVGELVGLSFDWGVFFASDSAIARNLALETGTVAGGAVVFASDLEPVHIGMSTDDGEGLLWRTLADFLLLSRSWGLVQCFDQGRRCGVDRAGLSAYGLVAAQLGLIPLYNYRVVTSRGCDKYKLFVA